MALPSDSLHEPHGVSPQPIRHPFEVIFSDEEFQYPDRDQVIREVVYRAPAALGAFTFVTHIPFINESFEDRIYNNLCESLCKKLHKSSENKDNRSLLIFFSQNLDEFYKFHKINDDKARNEIASFANHLDQFICDIIEHKVEYFIFGAFTSIFQFIQNDVANKSSKDPVFFVDFP